MALDDFMQTEVAVAAAATAAVCSPRVRGMLRRGAVLGLAGALMAGDALATFTRGVARGAQQTAASTATAVQDAAGATARAAQATTNQATAGQEGDTRRRGRTAHVTAPDGRGDEA
jgi:hypothetical protein